MSNGDFKSHIFIGGTQEGLLVLLRTKIIKTKERFESNMKRGHHTYPRKKENPK
jgi:hypothetical protein